MLRVLIAEKSQERREAMIDALGFIDLVRVQGAVSDLRTALHAIAKHRPDIVVTGTELADGAGLELIQAAQQAAPGSRIVVVGDAATRETCRRHLAAGAHRFVDLDPSLRQLREVVAGLAAPPTAALDDELRLLGRMAAGSLHDLNNYLGVLHATFTLIERAPGDRELLAAGFECVAHAGRLTAALLERVHGQEPTIAPVSFARLVRKTVGLVDRTLSPGVAIRVEADDDLPEIRGIASELEQLVLNLVLNAVDAMPHGGDLVVRVLPTEGAAVYLEVCDTGTGLAIEPPPLGHITTISTKPGRRTGLGLGIVQRVVDRHAGAFAIAPRRECAGTVAIVFLPAA